ncbi:glycosyltransferase family 4 protein [Candidatus Micrarchaeota archaeon]|nr:glycosyltransferase family 4 protein [Candidatus Micrarchaeota archaeon]
MKIAFFNWRDIRHPAAGGAEVYIHMLMRSLAKMGHEPVLFCSSYPGASARSRIDGIDHVRYGGKYMIYPKSLFCYRKHIRGRFDLIVDTVNGIPFFTPLFARERVVPLIFQLTRENWFSALPSPAAFAGYHLEDAMLSPYRNLTAFVPSPSTRDDLLKLGFRDVRIIYGAADVTPADIGKDNPPAVIYLGRLTKSKRVDHALEAFRAVNSRFPASRLWIAGSGPQEGALRRRSQALGLGASVEFFGRVGQAEKSRLLSRASLMLFPAVREGWGLTVLEANACRTPVIGYDVPGLRDSIRDGVNGMLVQSGDSQAMGVAAAGLLSDNERLERLSDSAMRYASGFSWKKAAEDFLSSL